MQTLGEMQEWDFETRFLNVQALQGVDLRLVEGVP